jgi:hypothetical protein
MPDDVKRVLGSGPQEKLMQDVVLNMVSKQWEVFHIIVEEGSDGRLPETKSKWEGLLGQRAIMLDNHTKLAEVIVSAIQVCEGHDHKEIEKSWDGNTSVTVAKAIKDLKKRPKHSDNAVVRF